MSLDRLRYELLLMSRRVILTPVLVMVFFGLFAGLLTYLKVNPSRLTRTELDDFRALVCQRSETAFVRIMRDKKIIAPSYRRAQD